MRHQPTYSIRTTDHPSVLSGDHDSLEDARDFAVKAAARTKLPVEILVGPMGSDGVVEVVEPSAAD